MRRMAVGMLAMLGVAMGLVGCGSDDKRLTQDEFVSQGNAICKKGNDRLDAAFEKEFGDASDENPPSEDQIAAFLTGTLVPEIENELDDLKKLNPPKATEDDFDAALKEAQAALDKIKDDPKAAANSDDDPFEKANELVGKAGLDVCAQTDE